MARPIGAMLQAVELVGELQRAEVSLLWLHYLGYYGYTTYFGELQRAEVTLALALALTLTLTLALTLSLIPTPALAPLTPYP